MSFSVVKCQIRPMDLRDVPQVSQLEDQSFENPWQADFFNDCLQAGYCCRVLEQEGVIQAYGVMSLEARIAHILNLCVGAESRGRGLGHRLLLAFLELAREEWAGAVVLEVRASNEPALQLYERMGFKQVDIRKNYYSGPQGSEDALVMLLLLDSRSEQ